MEICAIAVKKHRTDKVWTQQHLADVCGVSLRTIQRVERYGTTSAETLMSLSSVFDVDHQSLARPDTEKTETDITSPTSQSIILLMVSATLLGCMVGALSMYWWLK